MLEVLAVEVMVGEDLAGVGGCAPADRFTDVGLVPCCLIVLENSIKGSCDNFGRAVGNVAVIDDRSKVDVGVDGLEKEGLDGDVGVGDEKGKGAPLSNAVALVDDIGVVSPYTNVSLEVSVEVPLLCNDDSRKA